MIPERKIRRYIDNLKEPALKLIIITLMTNDKEGRKFVEKQIEEFNKMYPKGSEDWRMTICECGVELFFRDAVWHQRKSHPDKRNRLRCPKCFKVNVEED